MMRDTVMPLEMPLGLWTEPDPAGILRYGPRSLPRNKEKSARVSE